MPPPRLTLGDLTRQVLAADAAGRLALVRRLARATRAVESVQLVADALLPYPPVFLDWIGHVHAPVPRSVLNHVRPLLDDPHIPPAIRITAAARVLRSSPDRLAFVRPVVKALTAGLSPLRRLDRLGQLQHQLATSRTLDALIARRERLVKLTCPRCGTRLPRPEMVKHLWHTHGLTLNRGKVRRHDPALYADGEPALRAAVAAAPVAGDVGSLLTAAAGNAAGLCPGCFAELPVTRSPLPAPLVVTRGRVAGNGYAVEVGGAAWLRTLSVTTPEKVVRPGPYHSLALGPRGTATLAASAVLLVGVVAAAWVPPALLSPLTAVGILTAAGAATYTAVRGRHRPSASPDDQAIDAAWDVLARRLMDRGRGTRFLTRLCRSSLGRGDPAERADVLARLVEQTTSTDAESLQMLAAAKVLQVDDGGRLGRDAVHGFVALCASAFRGETLLTFAEHVVEVLLDSDPLPDPATLARLRPLLIAAAFDAGLRSRDLIDLWPVAPHLRRVMGVEPPHRLGLLHGIWRTRADRPWERVGEADTVFELCRNAPNISGRLLTQYPDLLLLPRPEPALDTELGPVLVCSRGVVVGGEIAADPDTPVGLVKAGRRVSYELAFGRHRIPLTQELPDNFISTVRSWLRFRAAVLLPYLDGYSQPGPPDVTARVLEPFTRACRQCGSVSAVAVGKVGLLVRTPDLT